MLAAEIQRFGAFLARSPRASLAAIFIVALACMLPGFATIAPLDGDEPGYAVAAREMVATGDYATVRLQTEETEWRPRGAYWIEAFLLRFAGNDPPIWVARLPSLAAGVAAALLTWWMAMAFGAPMTALIAGLFVAASGIVGLEARLATPDAILLAATTLCGGGAGARLAPARWQIGRLGGRPCSGPGSASRSLPRAGSRRRSSPRRFSSCRWSAGRCGGPCS